MGSIGQVNSSTKTTLLFGKQSPRCSGNQDSFFLVLRYRLDQGHVDNIGESRTLPLLHTTKANRVWIVQNTDGPQAHLER